MTRKFSSRLTSLGALIWPIILAGCGSSPPPTASQANRVISHYEQVRLIQVDDLMEPGVNVGSVFRPAEYFSLEGASAPLARFTGFRVTVATSEPERIRVQLTNESNAEAIELTRQVPEPAEETAAVSVPPRPYNDSVRNLLDGQKGVFWALGSASEASGLDHQFAIIIPEVFIGPDTLVHLFTATDDYGVPVGSDAFGLAPDFFYMAVIGDSIQWGQGLREADKMSSLVAQEIEARTGRHVVLQRYAISGSTILPAEGDSICTLNCSGEVPTARTSITVQADLIERPDLMELILLDGCINDVGVDTILDPGVPSDELADLTEQFCDTEMATLLRKVSALAPNALLVVTGYYQIVGPEVDPFGLKFYAQTQGLEDASLAIDDLVKVMSDNSIIFNEGSQAGLAAAISAVNGELPAPRIGLAAADFGPENGVFGPDAWLFGTTAESEIAEFLGLDLDLFPEDPLANFRSKRCVLPETTFELVSCLYVSLGHPNIRGGQAFAEAVLEQLEIMGALPGMDAI